MAIASTGSEVHYPDSDGKPMAETPYHRDVMFEMIAALRAWYAGDPLAYVSGNMFLYFAEGDPKRNVSPDVMVVLGIDGGRYRATYKTWEEGGKGPDLVVEITSKSTRREDLKDKLLLYRDVLEVPEYFLFDPLGDYLDPPLQGFRLVEGAYEPIVPEAGRLPSLVLDLHLERAGDKLRLFDHLANQWRPTQLEALEQKEVELRRARAEVMRREFELRTKETTIENQGGAIEERDLTIREQAVTIREKEVELREAGLEIDRLRRELEASRGGPPTPGDPGPKPNPRPKRK